jgi:hypothetical protein
MTGLRGSAPIAIALALLIPSFESYAQTPPPSEVAKCRSIQDSARQWACFNALNARMKQQPKPAPAAPAAGVNPPATPSPNTDVAEQATATTEFKTSPGQPFCFQIDQLKEYLLAGVNNDQRWMKELDCYPIVGGAKVTIIEEYPSDSDIAHVVKVRIFSPSGKGSVVGYTLSLGIGSNK